ncbi:MAG TPA: DUF2141 domain-containing protein [Saprospiraceae bacterium]|nr:DUF2141 domain-containing protein [Saprospiraceae bacterium]HMP22683.1 DUF2141 domain-containing protein [Saprospiraceae bacterium]
MKKIILFSALFFLSLAAQAQTTVAVQVENLKNDKGVCRAYLFDQPAYFPNKVEKALASKVVKISENKASLTFENVPAGTYAISVIHDENNNGKLDANMLGIPTESYGASKNALPSMRMPSFEANSFQVAQEAQKLTIKIK